MKHTSLSIAFILMLFSSVSMHAQSNVLSVSDVTVSRGKIIRLPFYLDNSADIVAVQFNVSFPDVVYVDAASASLSERCDGHSVRMKQLDEHNYLVMVYSADNKAVVGRKGILMSVELTALDNNEFDETTAYTISLSDVVLGGIDGKNMVTDIKNGSLTYKMSPDLAVSDVSAKNSNVKPGDRIEVSWKVTNAGGTDTEAGWSESIYLVGDNGTSKIVGTVYHGGILKAEGVESRTAELKLPSVLGLDGNARLKVKVVADNDTNEPDWLLDNNVAISTSELEVSNVLTIDPQTLTVDEISTRNIRFYLQRSGDASEAESFSVKVTEDPRIVVPGLVEIPEAQSGVYFYAQLTADKVYDARDSVLIEVSNPDFETVSSTAQIEDDTYPNLYISSSQQDVTEGGTIKLTVSAEYAPAVDTEIKVSCDLSKRFTIPGSVMHAGETSVDVIASAIENNTPDIEQVVMFTASASGYNPATVLSTLIDNDIPALQMTITPDAVSESAGPLSLTARITRLDNIDKKVTIKLSDDSNSGIYYSSQSFTMESGVEEATLNLGPVDNALVDGERTVNVTASVYISSCSCSAGSGKSGGLVTVPLTIYDNDGPALSLQTDKSVLLEGGEIEITVKRNTSTASALTVTLSSDRSFELEMPSTVVILAGKDSEKFIVKSGKNGNPGDSFSAAITASADGYSNGVTWFTVSDQTLPDARITSIGASSAEAEVGETVTVTATVTNTGNYLLPAATPISIYISSGSSTKYTAYLPSDLVVGDSASIKTRITLPSTIGTFNIYAVVNEQKSVKELSYANNSSSVVYVRTVSPFTVTVGTDKDKYKSGERAVISGTVTGKDVSGKDVEVYVINSNYRHAIKAVTEEDGSFSVDYTPYEGQVGYFVLGACYPGENLYTKMASFSYYGIKRESNSAVTCEALLGDVYRGSVALSNPSVLGLTGLKASVVSKPDDCDVTLNCPAEVKAEGEFSLDYEITPLAASTTNDWEQIVLNVESDEGALLTVTLYYYCRIKTGQLKASVSRINTTMIKGQSRDYIFEISNTGKGETGKITVEVPSWMSMVTPKEMPSLEYGESASVIIRLTPDDGMQLNVPVTGQIGINCENGTGLPLPFSIEPVSETNGTLVIDVCDENTYYSQEAPHLQGAEVCIYHPSTGTLLEKGFTGSDGKYSKLLPEGYYSVSVTAEKHESFRNNILVSPGIETVRTINLSYTAITVDWKVEETEVEDQYIIVSNVTYETNVPKPVVIINAPTNLEADKMAVGEQKVLNVILTNKGLVEAMDAELILPENTSEWSMEALSATGPFNIAPQQSVAIPILFTNLPQSTPSKVKQLYAPSYNASYYSSCMTALAVHYKSRCGTELKNNEAAVDLAIRTCIISHLMNSLANTSAWLGGLSLSNAPGLVSGGGNYSAVSDSGSGLSTVSNTGICDPETAARGRDLIDGTLGYGAGGMGGVVSAVANGVINGMAAARDIVIDGHISLPTWANIAWNAASPFVVNMWDGLGNFVSNAVDAAIVLMPLLPSSPESVAVPLCRGVYDSKSSVRKTSAKYDWMIIYDNSASKMKTYCDAYLNMLYEFYGDEIWYKNTNQSTLDFFEYLKSIEFDELDLNELRNRKPDNVTDEQLNNLYIRLMGSNPNNNISIEHVEELIRVITEVDKEAIDKGYESYPYLYYQNLLDYEKSINEPSNSMCATITLEFSQTMTMTRQAFRGTLNVHNGNKDGSMRDVKLNLNIYDDDGVVATNHEFQISTESIDGFEGDSSLTAGWTLAADAGGTVSVLFIPTKYAAPFIDKVYYFGGSLSYIDPNTESETNRELSPVALTVKPSPDLNLTYFMQRDIRGDDPLTEETEPCEEAEFSLLINNIGYGDATNVRMVTEQPEIIDNEKGLHIDFELMSSQLNGGDKTLALGGSVATDFGTIPAKSTSYAQWWIKSPLLGHFTEYNVKATHVTSYDNPDLTLLNEVTIHELIRSLEVKDGKNTLVGFMTNDIADSDDIPDMLYLSNGDMEPVKGCEASVKRLSGTEYELTVIPSSSGWIYGNVTDPTYGFSEIKSIVRKSDSKQMSLRNFWQTDRTLRDGKDPLYENRIHFADAFESSAPVSYILSFDPLPQLLLAVTAVDGLPEEDEIAEKPIESVNVVFNKQIDPLTFTAEDLSLAVQGVKQDASSISIATQDNKTFTLGFSKINEASANGYYVLQIQTDGITDVEGFNGKTGKSADWIFYREGLTSLVKSVYPEKSGIIDVVAKNMPENVGVVSSAQTTAGTGADGLAYGETYIFSATPEPGYKFLSWTVNGEEVSNESQFEYTVLNDMQVVAAFALNTYSVDVAAVSDSGSVIGASTGIYGYGEELSFTAVPDEDFVFDYWMVNGVKTEGNETLVVTVDKQYAVSAVFQRAYYYQNMVLYEGWNWVSSYLKEPVNVSEFATYSKRILGQIDEVVKDPVYGMVGGLGYIEKDYGYKILASSAFSKNLRGHLNDESLNLKKGWNWISYPYFEERTLAKSIPDAEDGDFMVSQQGFSEFSENRWEGTLSVLTPGQGYLYKSAGDKALGFDFTADDGNPVQSAASKYPAKAEENNYEVDIHKYPSTMNVTAIIYKDGIEMVDNSYVIIVYAGDECRGVSQHIGANYYITVYGEDKTLLTFVIKDPVTLETVVIENIMEFNGEIVGSRKEPYRIDIGQTTDMEGVFDNNNRHSVYTAHGIYLECDTDRLMELPCGIYVVDGKKVFIH